MAAITFKGFVQAHEGNRPWEIAEGHSTKDADDKWITKSKTYHKVWLPRDHAGLNEGDLVEIAGKQITPEKKNEHKPTPIVYADAVTVIKASNGARAGAGGSQAAPQQQNEPWAQTPVPDPATDVWNTPDNSTIPF